MAATSVVWRTPRGATFGKGYSRKWKRVARVVCDSESDGALVAGYAAGVSVGDPYVSHDGYETDDIATCVEVDVQPADDSNLIWLVTCTYETADVSPMSSPTQSQQPGSGGGGGGGDANDPTQWLPKKSWTYGTIQLVMRKAFDADNEPTVPVVNSAGFPFDPGITRKVKYSILTITRYEETFDRDAHETFAGATNEAAWNGKDPHAVMLDDWQVEEVPFTATLSLYRHTRVFHFAPPAIGDWRTELLDAGNRNYTGAAIIDPLTRSEVNRDWPLDEFGEELDPVDIAAGNFHWLTFKDKPTMDFDSFNIIL